jgi:hypothetical protein
MNIKILSNATTASIKNAHPVPRGATHFCFTEGRRNPVVDKIENLDTLAGCSGRLEYGKVEFEGRGRHAKIKAFTVFSTASTRAPRATPEPPAPEAPMVLAASRPKGTKLNRIMGFSACAVAKALGKAGVKHDEAASIFLAHGITMPKASLSVQLGFGRNPAAWERHGKPAELTDSQIAELRAGAVA